MWQAWLVKTLCLELLVCLQVSQIENIKKLWAMKIISYGSVTTLFSHFLSHSLSYSLTFLKRVVTFYVTTYFNMMCSKLPEHFWNDVFKKLKWNNNSGEAVQRLFSGVIPPWSLWHGSIPIQYGAHVKLHIIIVIIIISFLSIQTVPQRN